MSKVNGLTDREQAIVVFLSGLLIAIGVITVPSDLPYHAYVGIILALLGAVGLSLKELAGGAITATQATLETISAALSSLTQLQTAKQAPPTPTQPPIDKTKLAADLAQMAMQLIEKATATPTPANAA